MLAEGREPALLEGVPGESRPKAEGGLTPLNPLGPLHGPQPGFLLQFTNTALSSQLLK